MMRRTPMRTFAIAAMAAVLMATVARVATTQPPTASRPAEAPEASRLVRVAPRPLSFALLEASGRRWS